MTDDQMTRREAEDIAEQAAEKAVHRTFRLFGVDTCDQNSINEFRSDLTYARRLRRLSEGTKTKAWLVAIGILTTGAAIALWDALKAKLGG